jgi:Zn-dependent peptidase ImmA (M78 family)
MSLDKNTGAKRAREAREDLGYAREGPLPDLVGTIEDRGGAHVVVLELPEGVAGAYVARADCPLVFVNGHQALARQRFTVAHEFGHHRMGHASVVDEQQAISGKLRDPQEVRANAFAAEFLMPRDAITAWGRECVHGAVTLEQVVLLACEYGVSAQAARYALQNAGVLSDTQRCEQLDEEIALELHVALGQQLGLQYPHDELADAAGRLPRIPSALHSSALGDLLAGAIDADQLAVRLGREPHEITAMLAELGIDRLLSAAS